MAIKKINLKEEIVQMITESEGYETYMSIKSKLKKRDVEASELEILEAIKVGINDGTFEVEDLYKNDQGSLIVLGIRLHQ